MIPDQKVTNLSLRDKKTGEVFTPSNLPRTPTDDEDAKDLLSRTGIQPAHNPHQIPAREDTDDDIPGLISDSESDSDDDGDNPRRVAPVSR